MTILGSAEHVVNVERQDEHGDPVPNLERDATMWSAILGVDVTAEQVALCMIAHKMVRASSGNAPHRDNLVDIAGYARIIEMIWERSSDAQDEATSTEEGTLAVGGTSDEGNGAPEPTSVLPTGRRSFAARVPGQRESRVQASADDEPEPLEDEGTPARR